MEKNQGFNEAESGIGDRSIIICVKEFAKFVRLQGLSLFQQSEDNVRKALITTTDTPTEFKDLPVARVKEKGKKTWESKNVFPLGKG